MSQITTRAIAVLAAVALAAGQVACTSPKKVMRPDPRDLVEQLYIGDEIYVLASNGRDYRLTVGGLGDDYLRGRDMETGKIYRIPFEEIVVLEADELDAGKTGASIFTSAVAVFSVVVVYSIWAFTQAFGGD